MQINSNLTDEEALIEFRRKIASNQVGQTDMVIMATRFEKLLNISYQAQAMLDATPIKVKKELPSEY